MKKLIIAIDGPSGAGKGTIPARRLTTLGYRHIDTGAMYRAVGWKARHDGIALDDEAAVTELAASADMLVEGGVVAIDGHDVTAAIRTSEVDKLASRVARLPQVRQVLVSRQRALGEQGGIIMEGRDIGSVVFPDADVKIYLDASAEERARRRATIRRMPEVRRVDRRRRSHPGARSVRRTRTTSPLALATGAAHIDTTNMPIETVIDHVLALVRELG